MTNKFDNQQQTDKIKQQTVNKKTLTMHDKLTAREVTVIELLSQGASNKTIASQLNITERTVKFHCSNLYKKLQVNNRCELIASLPQ